MDGAARTRTSCPTWLTSSRRTSPGATLARDRQLGCAMPARLGRRCSAGALLAQPAGSPSAAAIATKLEPTDCEPASAGGIKAAVDETVAQSVTDRAGFKLISKPASWCARYSK